MNTPAQTDDSKPSAGAATGSSADTGFTPLPDPPLIRRCLWCKARTGAATYWHEGEWIHLPSPAHFFGTTEFTDGLCEDCMNKELATLLA
jgi:hypothetical protein